MNDVRIGSVEVAELEEALKKHDWYYMMSDSMKVFDAGEKSAKKIRKMVIELDVVGHELYNKYAPEEFKNK